ncbi:beach-domain-containing protein [Gigaspora margarita]|uniref:Beach-domain-containing protein n=1 Tax=Gigaspora margarita TaxID=4874 RepID=A0A8H3XDJ1_GIGMA|nr:beach-domain-containing protein [Gigaspora margarita]
MKICEAVTRPQTGVQFVAIIDTTGDIATCSGSIIRLWSINGDLLITKNTSQIPGPILCCVFYEGSKMNGSMMALLLQDTRKACLFIKILCNCLQVLLIDYLIYGIKI